MSLHLNGLPHPGATGLTPADMAATLGNVNDPNLVGAGLVLSARGNVYGDVRTVDPATVATRRRANRAARRARAQHRKAAR